MELYNRGPFSERVPKILQLLLLIVYAFVFFNMNAVYTTNISFLVGDTGEMSEYFVWANYAMTIGMGAVMPLIVRIKSFFKSKQIMIFSLFALMILFLAIGNTKNGLVFVGLSLLIGFFKMLGMMEINLPLLSLLSKDGNKGRFYAVFYFLILVFTQLSGYYAVKISLLFGWNTIYYSLSFACLLLILISLLVQHNLHFMKKVPLYDVDWFSFVIYTIDLMFLAYILSFGKQKNWFDSLDIIYASFIFIVLLFLFILRQQLIKRPYLSIIPFKKRSVISGLVFLSFLGVFLATSSIQNTFAVGILGYDLLATAYLNVLMIPGLFLALLVCLKWFSVKLPVKMLVFLGFSSFTAYSFIMYYSIGIQFDYNNWYLLQFLKGLGMGILFIVIWRHALDQLSIQGMLWVIGVILVWRTFVSLGVFSSLFSWYQSQIQIQSLNHIAIYLDYTNLFQIKSSDIKDVQYNAILVSIKIIYAYVSLLGFIALLYVLMYDFILSKKHTY